METTKQEIKDWLKKQASKGGKKTVELYGKRHMSNIVKKRWAKQKALDTNE